MEYSANNNSSTISAFSSSMNGYGHHSHHAANNNSQSSNYLVHNANAVPINDPYLKNITSIQQQQSLTPTKIESQNVVNQHYPNSSLQVVTSLVSSFNESKSNLGGWKQQNQLIINNNNNFYPSYEQQYHQATATTHFLE